jgi:hypothetical protein
LSALSNSVKHARKKEGEEGWKRRTVLNLDPGRGGALAANNPIHEKLLTTNEWVVFLGSTREWSAPSCDFRELAVANSLLRRHQRQHTHTGTESTHLDTFLDETVPCPHRDRSATTSARCRQARLAAKTEAVVKRVLARAGEPHVLHPPAQLLDILARYGAVAR